MIELRHLRYFIAVAEELNFHRAAERVLVDPSALSRAVRELEGDAGAPLLARASRSLRLTPAGAELLDAAREVLLRVERARRRCREVDAQSRIPLRLGIADGLSQPRLTRCLSSWRELAPETPLELTDLRAADLADALRREELDVGFSFGVVADEAIAQEAVWSYPLVAVSPSDHELARRVWLSLAEVLSQPMVAWRAREIPGKRRQIDEVVAQCGASPVYAGEVASMAGFINMVGTGMGVGLTDAGHMETLRRSDIAAIAIRDASQPVRTYVLHKRQDDLLQRDVQRFVAHAKSVR